MRDKQQVAHSPGKEVCRGTAARRFLARHDGGGLRRLGCRALLADGAVSAAATTPQAVRIRSILDDLIRQRRRMQATQTDRGLLEANRLGIVYWQWQLSRCAGAERGRGTAA